MSRQLATPTPHSKRWLPLLVRGCAVLGILYLVPATGFFVFMKHQRGLDELTWTDIAVPTRWSRYRLAVGKQQIARGQFLARTDRAGESLLFLQAGLHRFPAHREGRLLLSRLLVATGGDGAAQDLLIEGLTYHKEHPRYLAELFGLLFQRQEDQRVLEIARSVTSDFQLPGDVRQLAALAAATGNYLRGDYDRAEDLLRSHSTLANSLEGRLLGSKINWERGLHELALVELHALAAAYPDAWDVRSFWTSRLRLLHRDSEARSASVAFRIRHPQSPAPRLELLHAYQKEGDDRQLQREIEGLLDDFPTDNPVLIQLGDFAASLGDVPLTQRLLDAARARRLAWEPHFFHVVEATLVARDYQGASDLIRAALREHPDWSARYGVLLDGMQAVVSLGAGDANAARLFVARLLLHPTPRADTLLTLAKQIAELGAPEQAREILARAFAAEPRNQAVLTRLIELELNLNRIDQLPAHLSSLVTMRQPSPEVLRVAQHKLGSDLFLFSPDRAPALDAVRFALERYRAPRF